MNAGVVICQAYKQKELEVVGTTCWSANPSGTYLITLLRGDDDDTEEKKDFILSFLKTIIFRAVWMMM